MIKNILKIIITTKRIAKSEQRQSKDSRRSSSLALIQNNK